MFRKILIAVVASLSLLSPLALPAVMDAHEPAAYHHNYRVYYRTCTHEPWRVAGSYHSRRDAYHEAHYLQARGFETVVR